MTRSGKEQAMTRSGKVQATTRSGKERAMSRVLDFAVSAAGLICFMPVFVALALVILWRDGPPVLFWQTRVGRGGRTFRIWKFRTMRTGGAGPVITAAGDNRVTGTGAWLRRYKLDELPQLFNVFRGDMSLVGPRPEVPEYVQLRAPIWEAILQVRPGITDPASLLYRNEEELLGQSCDPEQFYRERVLPAKLLLNLEYLRKRSFMQDLKLIWLTVRYSLDPAGFDPQAVQTSFSTGAGNDTGLHSLSSALDR
jgi:lipopolysaccharide/colanic/teichoic acid biosynthesis glycosyltransferase